VIQKICAFLLYRVLGWSIQGKVPFDHSRLVYLCVAHTSNWDFVLGMLFIKAENVKLTLFGKDGFYFFPFNHAYHYLNVVPIRRDKKSNFVEQSAKLYDGGQSRWTGIAPEGTRSYMSGLKSGYYYLAKTADVPVTAVGLDYKKKQLVLMAPRAVLASFAEDEADVIAFSQSLAAKRPELNVGIADSKSETDTKSQQTDEV